MVRRRRSRSGGEKRYPVGYRRPPVHSRYQPGQSGNPSGRRKGVRNLATDVKRTLLKPVTLRVGGRTQKRTTQESLLLVLREKALQGELRAIERLLDLAQRFSADLAESSAAQPLSADDQAILDAYRAECAAAAMQARSTEPSGPTPGSGGRSRKRRSR